MSDKDAAMQQALVALEKSWNPMVRSAERESSAKDAITALKAALEQPPLPVQEPKKRCCDHDSDCSVHNGDALPVGPCDCSQTFISSPDLGIVVTASYQLAVLELAKLVENNFGQMPRNDKWADKVLLVRDTFEAAHNIKEQL